LKLKNDDHLLELRYFKSHLFGYSLAFLLTAIFLLVIFKKTLYGLISIGIAVAIQLVAITMRVLISGRAPITNMYETVMFSGLGALIIGLIIYAVRKDKKFVLAGSAYNILCLMMMIFANNMISAAITPLVRF
jgi:ABC-type transport system involved in cytochrome c biogenesis permease subunit